MKSHSSRFPLAATAIALAGILCPGERSTAATVIETFSSTPGVVVPDNNASGIVDTISVTTSLTSLDKVTVTLNTSGGWSGDLYAYLYHDGVTTILLNRPARTATQPAGSSASTITVTLDDAAPIDVHDVGVGATPIVGTYQPDGRTADPASVTEASARTTTLADFLTTSPGGDWSIFIADTAGGDEATLVSWGLTLSETVIPEPSGGILCTLALLSLLPRRRRVQDKNRD